MISQPVLELTGVQCLTIPPGRLQLPTLCMHEPDHQTFFFFFMRWPLQEGDSAFFKDRWIFCWVWAKLWNRDNIIAQWGIHTASGMHVFELSVNTRNVDVTAGKGLILVSLHFFLTNVTDVHTFQHRSSSGWLRVWHISAHGTAVPCANSIRLIAISLIPAMAHDLSFPVSVICL